jgi:tetratricopeptide (TPR) repeat protein
MANANAGLNAIMNDDMVLARTLLSEHDDGFHQTGLAIAAFLEAMLGGEKQGIQRASDLLNKAHTTLDAEAGYAQTESESVFPNGSAYRVILANVLLMSAITSFLSHSMTDVMAAVWKLKRAYGIFDNLHGHIQARDLSTHFSDLSKADPSVYQTIDYQTYCATVAGYGMQTLVISLLPPKIARVLSIVGFKGSRTVGLDALWSIAETPTVQGSLALLGILLYYGGLLHFCDIVPDSDKALEDCARFLEQAGKRYPESAIWRLQAARLKIQQADLPQAIQILQNIPTASQMKQIATLKLYDLGLCQVFSMNWSNAIETYLLVDASSDWSHCAYSYICFICVHQQWRATKDKATAERATEFLQEAASSGGTKKMMGKPIPFEAMVLRKHARWTAISSAQNCPLIEAVDGCPAAEFVHFFNGWKSMQPELLEAWLALLAPKSDRLDRDAVTGVIRAAILRNLGRLDEAEEVLAPILQQAKHQFKEIPHSEVWIMPFANYEQACIHWVRDGTAAKEDVRFWIQRASAFGDSEMESRLNIRLTTAMATIDGEK